MALSTLTKTVLWTAFFSLLFIPDVKGGGTHKAIEDIVPISFNSTAVLKCYTHGMSWPSCFPTDYNRGDKNCKTVWMKDGNVLQSGDKFDVSSKLSYNFCEIFPETDAMLSEMGLPVTVFEDKVDYEHDSGQFECYVSTLTIKNIEDSDLGTYQCNFSNHQLEQYREFEHLANVSLVNVTDYTPAEPKVEIVNGDSGLAQCISFGKPLDWYYVIENSQNSCFSGYDSYTGGNHATKEESAKCLFKRFGKKIINLPSEDLWRCFEVSEVTHQPDSDTYESFLLLKNICKIDHIRVYCGSADGTLVDYKQFVDVKRKSGEIFWDRDYSITIMTVIIVLIVVILLITFSILACTRISCGGNEWRQWRLDCRNICSG